jgi:hypothetical protein
VSIEWNDVARITSPSSFVVELDTAFRYFGTLVAGAAPYGERRNDCRRRQTRPWHRRAHLSDGPQLLAPSGWIDQRRIQLHPGERGNAVDVFHPSSPIEGPKWVSTLTGDSLLTDRRRCSQANAQQHLAALAAPARPEMGRVGFSQLQQNEELSLNLRAVFGGGPLRAVVQTNQTTMSLMVALRIPPNSTREADDVSVLEAVAGADWDWFTYDAAPPYGCDCPDLFTRSPVTPGSAWSSTRVSRGDIISDLYWSINMFESLQQPAAHRSEEERLRHLGRDRLVLLTILSSA